MIEKEDLKKKMFATIAKNQVIGMDIIIRIIKI